MQIDWRSCDNCNEDYCPFDPENPCNLWSPIPCPNCGGALSETRKYNGKEYRHCYACHAEFKVVRT